MTSGAYAAEPPVAGLLDEVEAAGVEEPEGEAPELTAAPVGAGADAGLLEAVEVLAALSEPDVAADAESEAVTAGAGSLVLAPPLSPPPLLRKSVTYQPEPLS